MPVYALIAFLSLPWALKAVRGSKCYNDRAVLIQALGNNVCFILITHVLLGSAYILARLFAQN